MNRLKITAAILIFMATAPLAFASEEFDKLESEYNQARAKWYELREQTRQTSGEKDVAELPPRPSVKFMPRFRAFADKHAGKPEATPALMWIIGESNHQTDADGKESHGVRALKLLTEHHAADPILAEHLKYFRYSAQHLPEALLFAFYDRVIEQNKENTAAAWALFGMGYRLYNASSTTSEADRADKLKQAVAIFQRTIDEYADEQAAKLAKGSIFEIEHLQVGMKAPDIVGVGMDGRTVKLSQYLGQVVVLDFWGLW